MTGRVTHYYCFSCKNRDHRREKFTQAQFRSQYPSVIVHDDGLPHDGVDRAAALDIIEDWNKQFPRSGLVYTLAER